MTNPYRDMCARMADELDHYRQLLMDPRRETHALATEARALLDQPEPTPQPPADGEVAELVWVLLNEADADDRCDHTHWLSGEQMRRIAELLQHPQPVPVSERPWERTGWCDLDGECWWCPPGCPPDGPLCWQMVNPAMVYEGWLLPANALPHPEANR